MNVSFLHMMSIWLKHLKKDLNDLENKILLTYESMKDDDDGFIILQNILNSMGYSDQTEFKEFLTNKYRFTFQ